ncbi:MAG: hypothetical protein M1819_003125 [Sarea resinae]|nr:MAG: hypothetical protein M1819_003125 [Sarea resinae]
MDDQPKVTTAKRACDACHRRKVKCLPGISDGQCKNCGQAGLACTYNAIPQKKGPKGSRAKVISELRTTQKQSRLALKINHRLDGLDSPPMSPAFSRTPGLLSDAMIRSCVDFFFAHMYPTMPILHRQRLEQALSDIDRSLETYCLVASLCAFMMIQPGMKLLGTEPTNGDATSANITLGNQVLNEALRVRKGYEYIDTPTTSAVVTSFFLFGCYFGLDRHNTAWFYLREATTLAQILGMQDEATYMTGDFVECSRRRRLFWLLFVTERAYALQRHRPLTLHATINLPTLDEDPSETVALSGFIHLVNLFRPFDDMFVGLWNKSRADCSTGWLAQLQKQLADALPANLESTEGQAADLRTSQQWLRTMVWQLSTSNGYLSSTSTEESMRFSYPIEIARDLLLVTGHFSQQSMEVHGIGLVEKLFDVACTLADVMSCVPIDTRGFEVGPRDYLNQLLSLIGTLRGGKTRFLPVLLAKINDTLPAISAPLMAPVPPLPIDDRVQEVYDSTSTDSTPLGSPPTPEEESMQFASIPRSAPDGHYLSSDAYSGLLPTQSLEGMYSLPPRGYNI